MGVAYIQNTPELRYFQNVCILGTVPRFHDTHQYTISVKYLCTQVGQFTIYQARQIEDGMDIYHLSYPTYECR